MAWRGRVHLWLTGHLFIKTNCSSTRNVYPGSQLWRRAGSFRSESALLTQSPSTWEVDASIECLLLWDELWTNAQNSYWHQQAERKREQRAQQCGSHVSQQRTGYSELRQKIRAKPQPTPRTAVLLTARLTILPCQSLSQKQYFLVFTLVTGLALKAQPASAHWTVMAAAFSSLRHALGQAACFRSAVAKLEHKGPALIVNLRHHMTTLFLLFPNPHYRFPPFSLTGTASQGDCRVQSTPVSPLKHQCQAMLDKEGVLLQRYRAMQCQQEIQGRNKLLLSIPCYHRFCVVLWTSLSPSDF